jgi:hypothetical protein
MTGEPLTYEEQIRELDALTAPLVAAQKKLVKWVHLDAPCVYVFTLPHYLAHPYDPASGRTLLKVGRSNDHVYKRILRQVRTTALPEDPELLRVYWADDPVDAERQVHKALEALGHRRNGGWFCGQEWFLTNVATLDKVARRLGLEVAFRERRPTARMKQL